MCVAPIRVKNPRLKSGTFDPEYHPLYLTVPCGKCYECQLNRQNSWYVRNYFQYKETIKKGSVFYYTLTYNDEHLLRIGGFLHNNIRCFSKDKVRKFIYRLSQRLRRKDIKLHYFIVSEYGSKYERPHHHAIFYTDSRVSAFDFSILIHETWKMGFVRSGNNFGVVDSLNALSYCCKYLTKGNVQKPILSPQNVPVFNKLANYLSRKFGTFTLNSSALGKCGLSVCNDLTFIDGFINIPFEGKYKKLPVPNYYIRNLVYDKYVNKNGNTCYKLSSHGFDLLRNRFNVIFDAVENKTKWYNFANNSSSLVTPELVLQYQLAYSMPLRKCWDDLFYIYWRRFKIGNSNQIEYSHFERYYGDNMSNLKYIDFLLFNCRSSYDNYLKRVKSYNVNQRVLYKHPKEVKILNFVQYVNSFNKLEIRGAVSKVNNQATTRNFSVNSFFKSHRKRKLKLCVLMEKCALPFLPTSNRLVPF